MAESNKRLLDPKVTLEAYWRAAASDLSLELEAPFSMRLVSGATVSAVALLRRFGAKRGMIIVSDYEVVKPHQAELIESGFGFSTMSDPADPYERNGCLEILRDWGWAGPTDESPPWL
jgi:hypothetical protein